MPWSKYQLQELKIDSEPKDSSQLKIVELEEGKHPVVTPFEFISIQKNDTKKYSSIIKGELKNSNKKNSRFSLNPLLRTPLSVDEEEKKAIEYKVGVRVSEITEEIKKKAAEEGYQEGLKKGYEESLQKLQVECATQARKFDQFVTAAENAKEEIFKANEKFLIEMIYRIAKMVILKDLEIDRDYIVRLVKKMIENVSAKENIVIRINPEDLKTVEVMKDNISKSFGELKNLNIESSSQIPRGGCQIETEWNAVDANIQTQLDRIYNSIMNKTTNEAT